MKKKKNLEILIERGLFHSRWLMTPIYVGLALSLFLLLYSFMTEFVHLAGSLRTMTPSDTLLGILSLIDLSLAGSLVLIVIFSGYENFVSKMDTGEHEDQPDWKGSVDFAALKLKLIASIVAISGIHLLKVFMDIGKTTETQVKWMVIIHVVFVISGVLLALMDRIAASTKATKGK